jgi:NAD(P)-dependent dehydrogenase (short-subunit alcohol dehydrogenase family)
VVTASDLFSLRGRAAAVTGATGYFGVAFCQTLIEAGARVALFGRSEGTRSLARALAEVHGEHRAVPFVVDLADDDAFRDDLARADHELGGLDVLVNNAFDFSRETGFNHPSGHPAAISRAQWMRGLESGVYWHASAIQVVGERMKDRGRGSIINVSSMYGRVAPDPGLYQGRDVFNPPTYSTAKAAILGLTRYVASFYGRKGVRCNALLPGAFPNPNLSAYNAPSDEAFLRLLADRTLLGRVGRVDDLRGAILFLASDASAYVTGQEIVVDGGWTVR